MIDSEAQVFYISSSQGNDLNDGLSIQTPFQSIDKLNTMQFSPGDTIYFKSGDYWEGMLWLKGSGSTTQPIVVDVYGGNNKPIINGFGYQASILIFNNQTSYNIYNIISHILFERYIFLLVLMHFQKTELLSVFLERRSRLELLRRWVELKDIEMREMQINMPKNK